MILKDIDNIKHLKSEWEIRFFKRIHFLEYVISTFFKFFLPSIGVAMLYFYNPFLGVPYFIFLVFFAYQIHKEQKNLFKRYLIYEAKISSDFIELYYLIPTKENLYISIPRKDCICTCHPRGKRSEITILNSDMKEYVFRRKFGLWWQEDIFNIYNILCEFDYPRKKISQEFFRTDYLEDVKRNQVK